MLILGPNFHVKSRSVKNPFKKTFLGAQCPPGGSQCDFWVPNGVPSWRQIFQKGGQTWRAKNVCVCMLEPGDKIYQNGSQNDPKIDSKLTLKSTIFVILFADSMFNFVFWPGGLLFFSRRKRQQQQKRKMKQGKTREDKARQAQGKTRQKEQKKTS